MPRLELVIAFIVIIVMEFRSSYGSPYPELNKRDRATVDIEIFGEARCTDTTKFLQKQLLPAYKTFGSRLNISYHPFGLPKFSKCGWNGTNIDCSCHHGLRECEKQALQACVISLLPETDEHLEIVSCIQGGDEFDDSVKRCLTDKEPSLRVSSDSFVRCAKSDTGRSLIDHHGSIQRLIAPEVGWVRILSNKAF
uniref:Gamma interferon inducible lysosomal thiol reductase n=1 Tax=Angiostrongylus cantonensis TaxID=6313 RepID=A0A0K0DE85_ANGCA